MLCCVLQLLLASSFGHLFVILWSSFGAASALRLRSAGSLYQGDMETLWDLVQKLLLDADVEVSCTAGC